MKGQMMIDCDRVEPSLLDSWHHLNMQTLLNGWGRSANRHLGEVMIGSTIKRVVDITGP